MEHKTEAEAVEAIVTAGLRPVADIIEPSPERIIVFPDKNVVDLERYANHPKRKRANVKLFDASSFIEYVASHKEIGTTIFGDVSPSGGSFMAAIDYDQGGPNGTPSWRNHFAQLVLAITPEWKVWIDNNAKAMAQAAFADFVESNMLDIVEPEAGALLDIVQFFQGQKVIRFKQVRRLDDGAVTLSYDEHIESTGGKTEDARKLPTKILLSIAPFVGSEPIQIEARLRYRIGENGSLTFSYHLNRPHLIIRNTWMAMREQIEKHTGLSVLVGQLTSN